MTDAPVSHDGPDELKKVLSYYLEREEKETMQVLCVF